MGTVVHVDFGGSEPWLTRKELAEEWGWSTKTIERFDREGLPSRQKGRFRLYKLTAARNWERRPDGKGLAHVG